MACVTRPDTFKVGIKSNATVRIEASAAPITFRSLSITAQCHILLAMDLRTVTAMACLHGNGSQKLHTNIRLRASDNDLSRYMIIVAVLPVLQ